MPPRSVPDHSPSRRDGLVAAVVRLVGDRGLDAVSVREVASAAGVSIGTVQHYFPTKDDLLTGAFEQVVADTRARLLRIRVGPTERDTMRRALSELLPVDRRRTAEARVYLAFAARATVAPLLQPVQRRLLDDIRVEIAAVLTSARGGDSTGAALDAHLLASLVDGLLLSAVSAPTRGSARRTRAALDRGLDLLLEGRPTRVSPASPAGRLLGPSPPPPGPGPARASAAGPAGRGHRAG